MICVPVFVPVAGCDDPSRFPRPQRSSPQALPSLPVPLRLSITPQITDAGTVVLRVTIENNTVNTGIAVGGVPGIDTQRMQSEVLVPDGGTTVMLLGVALGAVAVARRYLAS